MKKKVSRLKKAAPLILLGLLLDHSPVSQRAEALVGGPFDDNNFPGVNADGTYSGTISGKNLTGIVSFGVSSSQETNGRFSIFHEGFVHYGTATGIADLASRRIAGSLLGVATLGGSGVNPGIGLVETTGGSGQLAAQTQSITVRAALEGSFQGRMKGYPQQVKFEGDGRLSTSANTAVVTTATTVPGLPSDFTVFFGAGGSPQLQSDSTADGSEDSNIAPTGATIAVDGNPQRAILRSETPFKIRGSRTSRIVYTASFSYTALPPVIISTPPVTTPSGTPTPPPP